MKKLIFTTLLLTASLLSFSQLNPVSNLTWTHWYDYPCNFYSLQWSAPNATSTDTLQGYNVYRNDTLWRFQQNTGVSCIPWNCTDPDFLQIMPFWIKVKAVYNASHLESAAIDSAFDMGIAISISEKGNEPVKIITNPISKGEPIRMLFSSVSENRKVTLFDALGTVVREESVPGSATVFETATSGLPSGVLYLSIRDGKITKVQKIMIR